MSAPSQLVATHMQCLRIPKGCFKDSALVWARRTGYDVAHVVTRAYAREMGWKVDAPAPTRTGGVHRHDQMPQDTACAL